VVDQRRRHSGSAPFVQDYRSSLAFYFQAAVKAS